MAKFCGKCGAMLKENAKYCGFCGTYVGDMEVGAVDKKLANQKGDNKIGGWIKIAVFLMIAAVVIVGIASVVLNRTGKRGFVNKVMEAYETYDIEELISLSSDVYYYTDEETVQSYFEDAVQNDFASLETTVGHSYKLSYEIEEIYELSEWKKAEVVENVGYWAPDFTLEADTLTEAEIEVTAKKGDVSAEINVTLTILKEGNDWKLLYLE